MHRKSIAIAATALLLLVPFAAHAQPLRVGAGKTETPKHGEKVFISQIDFSCHGLSEVNVHGLASNRDLVFETPGGRTSVPLEAMPAKAAGEAVTVSATKGHCDRALIYYFME
jgi:hypothetical protein